MANELWWGRRRRLVGEVSADLFDGFRPVELPLEADTLVAANQNLISLWHCSCGSSDFELLPDRIRCRDCKSSVRGYP